MAIALSKLLERVTHMDITLIAGKKGLSNMVSWVHMIETKEASTFLEGGEIAFITGIGLSNSLSLVDLIESIRNNNAAGVILNIGPFLEHIPQEVIDFGDFHDFPIFMVPWKIHIAEIMHIFSYLIIKSEQTNFAITAAFKNAISFPKQEELYTVPLSQHGFHTGWNYYVCVTRITHLNQNAVSQNHLESLCLNIDNYLKHRKYEKFAIFNNENELVSITGDYSEEMMDSFAHDILAYLSNHLRKDERFFISVGKSTKSVRCLYKSYHQALSIQNFSENKDFYKNFDKNSNKNFDKDCVGSSYSHLLAYSNMGIYKLLLGIEDKDIMEEYYEKTIQPLIEYDKKNHSDFANVLWVYLQNNGSVKDTADKLYVHRNTINYKINKAAEILDLNLSSLDVRLQLTLGFLLQDML